jgi:hypothetical protein
VPTPSHWHPLPATAVANANSAGEEKVSVPEVSEVMEVMMSKVMEGSEVVLWKHRAMVERVGHAKVVWAAEVVHAAKAVHTTKAVHAAAHAAHHRVG